MRQRTDPSGKKLTIKSIHLVIPPELEYTAFDLLARGIPFAGTDANSLGKFIAGVHTDPYIATAGANIPWYLVADPREIPSISVVRMNGWNQPVVSMKKSDIEVILGSAPAAYAMGSFDTGNIEYQVADIVGGWDDASFVGVTDYRGVYYSSGDRLSHRFIHREGGVAGLAPDRHRKGAQGTVRSATTPVIPAEEPAVDLSTILLAAQTEAKPKPRPKRPPPAYAGDLDAQNPGQSRPVQAGLEQPVAPGVRLRHGPQAGRDDHP